MYNNPELNRFGPDVIINSYSTNDALPPWNMNPDVDDPFHLIEDRTRERLDQFVREALQSKSGACNSIPPLVVHVDDYVGPHLDMLLGELSYVSSMTQISKYYDTFGVSYGDVVRDLVYTNQSDITFANLGKNLEDKSGNVHYGPFAHQTIAWSLGYASLELLVNYCDDEHRERTMIASNNTTDDAEGSIHDSTTMIRQTNNNKNDFFFYLPPPLTRELLLKNATNEFTAAKTVARQSYSELKCTGSTRTENDENGALETQNPCTIAGWRPRMCSMHDQYGNS